MNEHTIWPFIAATASILVFWLVLLWALNLPEVHYSNRSGECVRVLYASVDYDCTNIPRRHRAVTVR